MQPVQDNQSDEKGEGREDEIGHILDNPHSRSAESLRPRCDLNASEFVQVCDDQNFGKICFDHINRLHQPLTALRILRTEAFVDDQCLQARAGATGQYFGKARRMAMPVALQAQGGAGSIQGTVTDPTGAVIPNAAVSADNVETGISSRTLSNRVGFFIFPSAQPGKYRVTAESPGMQKWEGQLQLQTGQDAVVTPVLAVGASSSVSTWISSTCSTIPAHRCRTRIRASSACKTPTTPRASCNGQPA